MLLEGGLTGQIDTAATGRRYLVSFLNGSGTPGSRAERVRRTGGHDWRVKCPGGEPAYNLLKFRAELKGAPIVPISLMRLHRNPRHVHDRRASGAWDLVLPIVGDEHVVSGGFQSILKGPVVAPADQREAFSSIDKSLVTWSTGTRNNA